MAITTLKKREAEHGKNNSKRCTEKKTNRPLAQERKDFSP
jgi:hypothetical protein